MNKDYMIINGKTIVSDEKGNKRLVRYNGNIDEVLEQENVVETIENSINELKDDVMKFSKKKNKKFIPFTTILTTIMTTTLPPILFYYLLDPKVFVTEIQSIFGTINQGLLLSIAVAAPIIPLGIISDIVSYRREKNYKKECQSKVCEYDYLCKQLVEEKEKLSELNEKNNVQKSSNNIEVKQISTNTKKISDKLGIYENLGYNYDDYYRLYKDGYIDKLRGVYTEDELSEVEEYMKEKGPRLVYKK